MRRVLFSYMLNIVHDMCYYLLNTTLCQTQVWGYNNDKSYKVPAFKDITHILGGGD